MGANIRLSLSLLSIISLWISADGFLHHSVNIRVVTRAHCLSAEKDESTSQDHSHRWKHEPFDFSSKYGWNNFYNNGLRDSTREDGDGNTVESLEFEWHSHIPHSAVVEAIEPTIAAASHYYSQVVQSTPSQNLHPSILLVGTGNSALPRILHDAFDTPVRVTCLDYSPVCIDMIKSMYEETCPNMDFVVGDATNLQNVLWDDEDTQNQSAGQKKHFDVIVDKGLLDALMCGEGFDIDRLMGGNINDVLTPHDWGMHVLICFQLSKASKQSLVDLGHDNIPGLVWDFDIPVEGSENGRAGFNLARRRRKQDARGLGVDQITTEWV
ncbi:hypothetical protein ACHAXR_002272 [Thalassiosira sp. AJA248-18]